MRRALATLATVLFISGCASPASQVRSTTSTMLGCPETRVAVRETERGWLASGCGKTVLCPSTNGPCTPIACDDVAKTDFRDCQKRSGDNTDECLNAYAGAIRACVIDEMKKAEGGNSRYRR